MYCIACDIMLEGCGSNSSVFLLMKHLFSILPMHWCSRLLYRMLCALPLLWWSGIRYDGVSMFSPFGM